MLEWLESEGKRKFLGIERFCYYAGGCPGHVQIMQCVYADALAI